MIQRARRPQAGSAMRSRRARCQRCAHQRPGRPTSLSGRARLQRTRISYHWVVFGGRPADGSGPLRSSSCSGTGRQRSAARAGTGVGQRRGLKSARPHAPRSHYSFAWALPRRRRGCPAAGLAGTGDTAGTHALAGAMSAAVRCAVRSPRQGRRQLRSSASAGAKAAPQQRAFIMQSGTRTATRKRVLALRRARHRAQLADELRSTLQQRSRALPSGQSRQAA